jgi:hypothetical protein
MTGAATGAFCRVCTLDDRCCMAFRHQPCTIDDDSTMMGFAMGLSPPSSPHVQRGGECPLFACVAKWGLSLPPLPPFCMPPSCPLPLQGMQKGEGGSHPHPFALTLPHCCAAPSARSHPPVRHTCKEGESAPSLHTRQSGGALSSPSPPFLRTHFAPRLSFFHCFSPCPH